MTKLSRRELLEYTIQFTHFEKTLAQWPGMNDTVSATLFGIDVDMYHEIKASFTANARQAAEELLNDEELAARVDRIPFAAGSKVVAVGSSATADYQSWFEILRHIFELRRPQDDIRFVNAGVSGDTTAHLMIRFLSVVRERPDWVIFHINANDARRHGLSPTKCLVSVEETEKNLEMLRHYVSSQTNAKWLWMTPTGVIEERIVEFPTLSAGQVTFHNDDLAAITNLLLKQPEPVVNLMQRLGQPIDPVLMLLDGLHPSIEGQKVIVDALIKQLDKDFH